MPAKRRPEVIRFHRVAAQRFEDAQVLFQNARTTGAMYLSGYAVECALKALLLAHAPSARRASLVQTFRGKIGHDLEWLRRALQSRGVNFSSEVLRLLRRVATWSTELRYDPKGHKTRIAQTFLEAVGGILRWVEGKL